MTSSKKSLILGIIIGIVLSVFFFNFFAPRYEIKKTTASTIKIDKWTGKAWRLIEGNWKEMIDIDEDWELVDKTLVEAININIPEAQVDSKAALKKLRDRYPIFKDIPDYDLLERIKLVYSKQLLVNFYLRGFMNVEKAEEATSRE
ncbi:MAG: hypothetical protein PVG39_06510 [Desulfobacteraceae bacterium]